MGVGQKGANQTVKWYGNPHVKVYLLYLCLDLRKQVNELDVSGEHELSCCQAAQVELGMQQLELN